MLIADVDRLQEAGILNKGQANALRVKLQNARAKLESGHAIAAANQLKAFRNQVRAFSKSGLLSREQAQLLDQAAADALSCL